MGHHRVQQERMSALSQLDSLIDDDERHSELMEFLERQTRSSERATAAADPVDVQPLALEVRGLEEHHSEIVVHTLPDMEQLATQMRLVPHMGSDGEIDGMKMFGIRRDSLPLQLGFRNGDTILTINDEPITSILYEPSTSILYEPIAKPCKYRRIEH